jgi:Tfp pilus assembly protein PilO
MALARRERTLIGLAAAGVLLIGGYRFLVEPALDRARERRELVPVREARLERRQSLVARAPELFRELQEVRALLAEQSSRLLAGPTPPLAASELQRLLKEMASEANVEVRSERVLPVASRDGGVQEIPIELTVAGGIRDAVVLLGRIERSPRLLTVQDVKVRVVSTGQARDLLTTVTVAGYLVPGGPAPAPAGPGGAPVPGALPAGPGAG